MTRTLLVCLMIATSAGAQTVTTSSLSPSAIQGVTVTTDGAGNFAGNWPTSFASEPSVALAAVYGQTSPFLCNVVTKSATGFTGKCFALATMTLPSTVTAMTNLVLSPFQNAAAGLTVTITGRQ